MSSDPAGVQSSPDAAGTGGDFERVSTRSFQQWVERGLALVCVVTLLPAVGLAFEDMTSLHPGWLAAVGGALIGTTLLMPIYAWSDRGLKPLAWLYSGLVLAGLVTWPLAWRPGVHTDTPPWIWSCIAFATICVAVASNLRVALAYSAVTAVLYLLVRTTESGGSAPWLLAFQDTAWVVVQPAALLLVLRYLYTAVGQLDASLERSHHEREDAAIEKALVAERTRLDAIVHDEVMTTLVAVARTPDARDPHVSAQAQHALSSLDQAEVEANGNAPVDAEQFIRLLRDVVASVCPRAEVIGDVPAAPPVLPHAVVRAMTQSTREATLNAAKHSKAEHIRVRVSVAPVVQRLSVRVEISDDGVGFDLAKVPAKRLGLRVSLGERMRSVEGDAVVESTVGRGTRVTLQWQGKLPGLATPRLLRSPADHPLLQMLDPLPFRLVVIGLTALYAIVALTGAHRTVHPALVWVAVAIVMVASLLTLAHQFSGLMDPWRARAIVACAVAASALGVAGLPASTPFPPHATWFTSAVMLLLIVVALGSRESMAWVGAALHAVLVAGAVIRSGDFAPLSLVPILTPLIAVGLTAFTLRWLDALGVRLEAAEASSGESAVVRARMFSKLVLREVWLADLKGVVGPLLSRIADESKPFDDDLRATSLATEATLRDAIRAANFRSPALSEAIMRARRRGVTITLVDNRGSRLPEDLRRVTVERLQSIVESTRAGRIVARTAPEGYDEAVTILLVDPYGTMNMTKIAADGTIQESTS